MATTTTAGSTTITFATVQPGDTGDTSNSIQVELDSEANGGKTTFTPDDIAYFLVYAPTNLSVTADTTLGTVALTGSKSVAQTETLQFVQETEANLSKIPNGAVTTEWIGRNNGSVTVTSSKVTVATKCNGVLKCTYNATAKAGKLSGVTIPAGQTEIEALVVVAAA